MLPSTPSNTSVPSGSPAPALAPEALLTTLLQQPLSQKDLSPDLFFLAAAITLLSGVMVIDGSVGSDESDHLHTLLDACVEPSNPIHPLLHKLWEGVRAHQVYLNPHQFLGLMTSLDQSARLLLLALGYNMALVDGHFDLREQLYLRAIAHRLQIPSRHQVVLEAIATQEPPQDTETLLDLFRLLHPDRFHGKEILRIIARTIHSNLPEPVFS